MTLTIRFSAHNSNKFQLQLNRRLFRQLWVALPLFQIRLTMMQQSILLMEFLRPLLANRQWRTPPVIILPISRNRQWQTTCRRPPCLLVSPPLILTILYTLQRLLRRNRIIHNLTWAAGRTTTSTTIHLDQTASFQLRHSTRNSSIHTAKFRQHQWEAHLLVAQWLRHRYFRSLSATFHPINRLSQIISVLEVRLDKWCPNNMNFICFCLTIF